jgi:hypothetical protein
MDFTSFETHELIALTKALGFVKFESQEAGASALAGSPILGQLYAQATQTLWEKAASAGVSNAKYFLIHGWPAVTERPESLAAIRFHLTQVEQWQTVADDDKLSYIQDLLFPLKATEETVRELLHFANNFHLPEQPSV